MLLFTPKARESKALGLSRSGYPWVEKIIGRCYLKGAGWRDAGGTEFAPQIPVGVDLALMVIYLRVAARRQPWALLHSNAIGVEFGRVSNLFHDPPQN